MRKPIFLYLLFDEYWTQHGRMIILACNLGLLTKPAHFGLL